MAENTQQISDLPQATSVTADDQLVIRAAADNTDKRVAFDIICRDPLRDAVEAQSGGRMTVLYDDHGNPNHMHILPKFTYGDLGFETEMGSGPCSAFMVNGVEKSEIMIGAYLASKRNGTVASVPGAVPWVNINWDESVAACAAMGTGWHLFSMHEQAAIALWCKANGFQPRGNTAGGKAHDASWEHGIDANQSDETRTGTGPATWRHTGDLSGIADLVGNVWDWMHGLKIDDGEIFATTDNHYDQDDSNWPTTNIYVRNDQSPSPMLSDSPDSSGSNTYIDWNSLVGEGGNYTSSQLLRRMLVEHAGIDLNGRFHANTSGVRFPRRGGARGAGSGAGLAALILHDSRSGRHVSVGFRPAFVA